MQLSYVLGANAGALKGCTLVMPAVAFANVGELAIDLLVTALEAVLVARVDSDNVLACVGNNAYSQQPPGLLATAVELYQVPGSSLLLLQQRAPALPGRQQAFATELAAWTKDAGFSSVLLLCGLDAQYRREQQLEGSQLRFSVSSSASEQQHASGLERACQAAGVLPLEADVVQTEQELHGLLPPWPTVQQLQSVAMPYALLSAFAAEGDNTADAMQLARAALTILQQQGLLTHLQQLPDLQPPCSWAGLFGRRAIDTTLF